MSCSVSYVGYIVGPNSGLNMKNQIGQLKEQILAAKYFTHQLFADILMV